MGCIISQDDDDDNDDEGMVSHSFCYYSGSNYYIHHAHKIRKATLFNDQIDNDFCHLNIGGIIDNYLRR